MLQLILAYPLEVILLCGTLFLIGRYGIPAFVSEKGKNLATQQDIQAITDKIEEIKIQYSRDLEQSKASLQQLVHKNNFFLQKSTELLLKFYDNLLILDHERLRRSFGDLYHKSEGDALYDHQKATEKLFTDLKVDYHRLLVFMDGESAILKKAAEIILVIMEIEKVFKKHILYIKMALTKETKADPFDKEYEKAVHNTDEVVKRYHNDLAPFWNQLGDKKGEFIGLLMTYLRRNEVTYLQKETTFN